MNKCNNKIREAFDDCDLELDLHLLLLPVKGRLNFFYIQKFGPKSVMQVFCCKKCCREHLALLVCK